MMATEEQLDAFEAHVNRIGMFAVAGALGFRGWDDGASEGDNYEALAIAFAELPEADAAQALRVLEMAR